MAWYNKNRIKVKELEEKNDILSNNCKALQEDIETLYGWLTNDCVENSDLKIKNARLRLINILTQIKNKKEIEYTNNFITHELNDLCNHIDKIKERFATDTNYYNKKIEESKQQLQQLKDQIIEFDDELLYQNFGLYTPIYNLMSSSLYKQRITKCREKQKQMIKNKTAAICSTSWTVNNSIREGKKMVNQSIKLLIRCFNNECDTLISKVKFNNYDSIKKRIKRSFDLLNELNSSQLITLNYYYLLLKLEELALCYEYEQKKNQEKEELRAKKEEEREQAKLIKEIEEARKKIKKEQTHYTTQLKYLNDQIDIEINKERLEFLLQKKADVENNLIDLDKALKDVDYREANQKAGYVYIISNIGAFGENVYKIGMTRRLNPQERIDELGGASVPFKFDVHALIFSDDAPSLEASLHRAFDNKKVNMANNRKEFFNVTLDEIKKVINDNYDKTVDFVDVPSAQQYRESLKIKEKIE